MANSTIEALRDAITAAGGSPSGRSKVPLLRELVAAWGGTPTYFDVINLLRQGVSVKGGTPTYWSEPYILRQLITTLGGTPTSYYVTVLYTEMAAVAGAGGVVTLDPLTLSNNDVPENSSNGTAVGTIVGRTALSTLSLTDDAGGRFTINSGTGAITVANGSLLNYESATSHNITVREVLAGASNTPRDTVLAINVTDVFEATLSTLSLNNYDIDETAVPGTIVGQVIGKTLGSTLTLTVSAGGKFSVVNSGVGDVHYVVLASGQSVDYDTSTTHAITIRETLTGAINTPLDTPLTVDVNMILESLGGTFSLAENAAAAQFAGNITGKRAGSSISLIDDAGARVAISGTTIVRGATGLDFETATSHVFTIRETHPNAVAAKDTNFTLTVTDVAEGGGAGTITTPIINVEGTLPGDTPPPWTIDFVDPAPDGAAYGDTIRLWYATSFAGLAGATPVDEVLDDELIEEEGGTLAPALFAAEFDAWALAQPADTTLWWQVAVIRDPGVEESDRSTAASFTVVDGTPTAVPFVDATGATISTRTWSADITIAGLATGAFARFTVGAGGEMRVTRLGEVTPEAATSSEVQVQNGDKLAVSVVASGLASAAVNLEVFQRGALYDTFTVTTAAPVGLDIQFASANYNGGTNTTYSFVGQDIGVAAADRDIICIVGRRDDFIPTSVTIGGVAATLRSSGAYDGTIDHSISIYTARVPAGTTADVNLVFPTNSSRVGIALFRMVGGTVVPKASGNTGSIVSGTALNFTPTIGAGQVLLAAAIAGTTNLNWSWTNATEVSEQFLSGTNLTHFSVVRNNTPGSPSITATLSGNGESRALAWAVFGAP